MTTFIARNLLPKHVISARQPEACKIRTMLADLAKARHARLINFCVDCGEARFQVDNDRAAYRLSEDIMDTIAVRPLIRRRDRASAVKPKRRTG